MRASAVLIFVHGLLAVILGAAACGAAVAQPVLAARVNGVGISHEVLDRQFEELLRERKLHIARMNNPAKAKSMKREVLDNLIRIELLWQEARAADLVVTDEELDRAIAEVRARFRTPDAFLRRIEQSGYNEATYREHTRKVLSGDRFAERIVAREVRITDDDVEAFYAVNPKLFRREEQLKARHILAAAQASAPAEQRAQARKKIEALVTRARGGEDFDALARHHSDDATRQWGGELDPFSRADVPKAFAEAAFALRPGQVSGVVETPAGFHVIKVEERIPAASVSLQEARERIREYLRGLRGKEAIEQEVEQLRALGKVEVLTPL
jgi:parvulin-like peptidyl-prolyl isomerase